MRTVRTDARLAPPASVPPPTHAAPAPLAFPLGGPPDNTSSMLIREDDRGVLVIGQPSHAWVSGQLARAWGNERFGRVEPFEEVCLAAEQHDVGWAGRDLEPIYNPETGLPRSFVQMPLDVHLELWREGPRSLLSQSRYAALLVSLHGWRLYERRDLSKLPPAEADAIRSFLATQRSFQQGLIASLRADPTSAVGAEDGLVERNSLLIWTWDYLSLALCLDWPSATAESAPTAEGQVDLNLMRGPEPHTLRVEPWPFATASVSVHCEGQRLRGRFESEEQMRQELESAAWETLSLRLEPHPPAPA